MGSLCPSGRISGHKINILLSSGNSTRPRNKEPPRNTSPALIGRQPLIRKTRGERTRYWEATKPTKTSKKREQQDWARKKHRQNENIRRKEKNK
jgi:hypothetical protein